jgi:NTE family protein
MYQLRGFVAVSLVFFSSVSGFSHQSNTSGASPRIGLALEGGGALGLAVSRSEHVFQSGPLDVALRSTMSWPGIFSPVRHETHIYVDGGLLNNFPVGGAKAMGADFVLGIHVETERLRPETSLSSFGVLNESIAVVIAANEGKAMKSADFVVTVPLQQFKSTDYDKAYQIIKAGYDAAEANAQKLLTLSVDEVSWKAYLA